MSGKIAETERDQELLHAFRLLLCRVRRRKPIFKAGFDLDPFTADEQRRDLLGEAFARIRLYPVSQVPMSIGAQHNRIDTDTAVGSDDIDPKMSGETLGSWYDFIELGFVLRLHAGYHMVLYHQRYDCVIHAPSFMIVG